MILTLSEMTFINDFFEIDTPDGNTLIINKIDECIEANEQDYIIDTYNIEVVLYNEFGEISEILPCPTVIGIEGKHTMLSTEYKQFNGHVLDSKNISYCTLEYYE